MEKMKVKWKLLGILSLLLIAMIYAGCQGGGNGPSEHPKSEHPEHPKSSVEKEEAPKSEHPEHPKTEEKNEKPKSEHPEHPK